jgi:UDP-N-acetylglucosamine--N-acetylmuramyl-(pentapeptide) pyrophosphoryl-undecaprenol N-acetylglucosamine transferase
MDFVKKPRVIITVGGTGGHIYPAFALEEYLEEYDVLYIASKKPLDQKLLKDKNHILFHLNNYKNFFNFFFFSFQYVFAFLSCLYIFLRKRPKAVFAVGSYTSLAPILAAFFLRIPRYLLEQNAIEGKTTKVLKYFVLKVFTNFQSVPGVLTGNPVRKIFYETSFKKEKEETKVLLILGGSLGSDFLNDIALSLRAFGKYQIYHQSGHLNSDLHESHYTRLRYLDDIAEFYKKADLIICRCGSSTLAELSFIQKPAILIPWIKSAQYHQYANAVEFKKQVNFPVEIYEESLGKEKIFEAIQEKISIMIDTPVTYKVLSNNSLTIKRQMNL